MLSSLLITARKSFQIRVFSQCNDNSGELKDFFKYLIYIALKLYFPWMNSHLYSTTYFFFSSDLINHDIKNLNDSFGYENDIGMFIVFF